MTANAKVRISGSNTIGDWLAWKATLVVGGDPALWLQAHDRFFSQRLATRYFAPIKTLQLHGRGNGEGFAIVALQCSLIEFLGATMEGRNYRHNPGRKLKLTPVEYDHPRDMFTRFLITYRPFNDTFDQALADDFYEHVRCGLLHEARTRKGWRILKEQAPGTFLDRGEKIIYRDNLQHAFETFAAWYRSVLPQDKDRQQAFLRKFDDLCRD
jgi:hypothetical protein